MKESTAYLIDKMLNSEASNPNMLQNRIRRKTVILSPKKESLEEMIEFPDDISECGTYTLDVDKPNSEAEAARSKIEEAFGMSNNDKLSGIRQTLVEENGEDVKHNVTVSRRLFIIIQPKEGRLVITSGGGGYLSSQVRAFD